MIMNKIDASLPFSTDGYLSIIEAARKAGYTLVPMRDAFETPAPVMILRHDVDFSPACALEMAKHEKDLGVRATYFFMTTSEYYNVFYSESRATLREIAGMGHEIGLHWDSNFLPEREEARAPFLKAQLALLGNIVGAEIISASQHIPIDTPVFDISPYIKHNAYSPAFIKDFTYVSDSSMAWRAKTPLDLITTGANIQFLAHPVWWMTAPDTREGKLRAVVQGNCAQITMEGEKLLSAMIGYIENRPFYDERFARRAAGGKE